MRRERGPFSRSKYGFAHLQFFRDRSAVRIIDGKDGKELHYFYRDLNGNVSVVSTTPSDKAKNVRPLKNFDEGDFRTPRIPSFDPEPAMRPTTQPMIEIKGDI